MLKSIWNRRRGFRYLQVMLFAIWYHLYNLNNVKNIHEGVLLLKPVTLLKVTLLHGCFSRFQNCTNCTKSSKASHMFSVTLSYASNKWKSCNHEISHVKEKLDPQNTHEILDPQNTDENNFGPTKYPREKILGSRNTHGKNLDPQNIYEKKFQTHEIPTRGTMALESQGLRWQVTQKNPSTLDLVREILNFIWRRERVKMMFQQ